MPWDITIENGNIVGVRAAASVPPGAVEQAVTLGTYAPEDEALYREAAAQIAAYDAGQLQDFDLPLAFTGTGFQLEVWQALQTLPYGQAISYGALAKQLGRSGAARAVGSACGANKIALIVPCHRVIAGDGSLGGYAYGLKMKEQLLAHEAQHRASTSYVQAPQKQAA